MDALKAEIAARKKRKAQAGSPSSSPQPASSATASAAAAPTGNEEKEKRYMRRGEEEEEERRRRELEEEREQEEKRRKRRKEEALRHKSRSRTPDPTTNASASSSASAAAAAVPASATVAEEAAASAISSARKEAFNISPQEAVQRLRAKGQPIRLFAESDKERRLRLRALELIEERGQKVGQNDFMKALQGAESGIALEELERGSRRMDRSDKEADNNNKNPNEADANGHARDNDGDGRSVDNERESRPGVGMNSLLDLSLIRTDIHKVYPIIYYTLKQLLTDWEAALSQRPAEVKATTQGKLVAATQRQTAEYLKPLFKKLRQRQLEPDVLMRIAEIVHYMQKREYRHANDSYLQLSIGNAPWPIGVTMVGIHERSGREKIFSSNVAHVLNDEVSRKYIQSLKRLMTFAQTKWPPTNLAMLMG